MTRILIVIPCLFLLLGCSEPQDNSELLGVWVSDKEMTRRNIKSDSSESTKRKLKTLENMLGEMAYVFKEKETTFTPFDSIEQQTNWLGWELVEANSDFYLVEVIINGKNQFIKFERKGQCIGLIVENSDFVEYFCKR